MLLRCYSKPIAKDYSINSNNYKNGSTSIKFALQNLKPMSQQDKQMKPEETEKILQEYRLAILEKGYEGLTKKVIPVVMEHGTVADKSALLINGRFDMERNQQKALISKTKAMEIRRVIGEQGEEAQAEYSHYIACYSAMTKVEHIFFRAKFCLISTVYMASLYYQTSEWLSKSTEIVEVLTPLIAQDKQAEAREWLDCFDEFVKSHKDFGYRKESKDLTAQIMNYRKDAETVASGLYEQNAITLKAIMDALQQFATDSGMETMTPLVYKNTAKWFDGGNFPEVYPHLFASYHSLNTDNEIYKDTYSVTLDIIKEHYENFYK